MVAALAYVQESKGTEVTVAEGLLALGSHYIFREKERMSYMADFTG